jgi:hypothetical protein
MKIQLILPLFFVSLILVNCSPKTSTTITQSDHPIIIPQAPNVSAVSPIKMLDYDLLNPDSFAETSQNNYTHACPVCHMNDQLIPIVYGRPGRHLQHKSEKGEIFLGGCVVSANSPKFMCKRDDTQF